MSTSSFLSLGVPADLSASLSRRGIEAPFPIQQATLPDALQGLDISAQSPTGTGKTLAFGIPLMVRVGKGQPKRPAALVLAPTRELAAQIAEELSQLGKAQHKTVATFYGGVGFKKQLDALRQGVDVAVGCPGRLNDLVAQRALNLRGVNIVVIDEADRMADMGFMPEVRRLLDETNRERQTLLFSATLQGDVERLIRQYQHSPKRFVLDAPEDAVGSRTHTFWRADGSNRMSLTAQIVSGHYSAIVFCRTKRGVDRLTKQLCQSGISAVPLHGDRSQVQRDRALASFHDQRAQVLVGTDVAARGIHVDDVGCVVHFDPPEDDATYLHRSGRTGRAGATGAVFSLVTREQDQQIRKIQRCLGIPLGVEAPEPSTGLKNVFVPKPGFSESRAGSVHDGQRHHQSSRPHRQGAPSRNANSSRNRRPGAPMSAASKSAEASPNKAGRSTAARRSSGIASANRSRSRRRPNTAA